MKTLGICIPTYRRPALLERCVRSAIASASGRPIKIVVADDSASDANVATLRRLIAEFPFIQWHRNERNLGIDANIQRAVDLCNADYAWLIGEDDTFLPGAVARMHERIQSLNAAFVFANYHYVDTDPSRVLGTALDDEMPESMQRDVFIMNHLWAIGFIGACVVCKSDWLATNPKPYEGTYYTHVGRIAEMLARGTTVAAESEPCVANRVEGTDTFTWKNDSYGVFFGFMTMCERVGMHVPELSAAMAGAGMSFQRRFRWLSLRVAARLRSEKAYDRMQFTKYLQDAPLGGARRLALFVISVTPPGILKPLVRLYRAVMR